VRCARRMFSPRLLATHRHLCSLLGTNHFIETSF
jgi:hypothetical protein